MKNLIIAFFMLGFLAPQVQAAVLTPDVLVPDTAPVYADPASVGVEVLPLDVFQSLEGERLEEYCGLRWQQVEILQENTSQYGAFNLVDFLTFGMSVEEAEGCGFEQPAAPLQM